MKSVLERIARALCSLDGLPENTQFEGRPMWESFLPQARAALDAIRTPTEEMEQVGMQLLSRMRGHFVDEKDVRDTWTVMVEAELRVN